MPSQIKQKFRLFPSLEDYNPTWIRRDIMAALLVTAIAIPESLGFAIIVGLPVQTGLYCALLAPMVFAMLTSSKRLVVGADSATAALVASGAATIAAAGSAEYANAVALLGIVTAAVLIVMAVLRFGFLADLISKPVLIGFVSGVGVQLLVGKLPEMLGLESHGDIIKKIVFVLTNIGSVHMLSALLALFVVVVVVYGWKRHFPGALVALVSATFLTWLLDLKSDGVHVVGSVPAGLPDFTIPSMNITDMAALLPAAVSIAIVILAQSLAVIRNAAAAHEEKVRDNQDLFALGAANAASAFVGGFAINGSPPRTSAADMAGGKSQLVNVLMSLIIGVVLLVATGLFEYVPIASLAAIVFTIGMHLLKIEELRQIWAMRRSEFAIAMVALVSVAVLGVQKGVVLAVLLSLAERLHRQYRPEGEILLRDAEYTEWAADRFVNGKHPLDAPPGLVAYRFNDALFFENSGYFMESVTRVIAESRSPVKRFILDASAISDIDYTAAHVLGRLIAQLNADDIEFCMAHVSPQLRTLLKRYKLYDLIGKGNIFSSLRMAIDAYDHQQVSIEDRWQQLGLKDGEYIVIGGAVLHMLGVRDTNDLDLVVSAAVYNGLKTKGWKEFVHDDGKRLLTSHGYRIMLQWMGRDLESLLPKSQKVKGITVMGLQDLVSCKLKLGRKKDLHDVELIHAYLVDQSVSRNKGRLLRGPVD